MNFEQEHARGFGVGGSAPVPDGEGTLTGGAAAPTPSSARANSALRGGGRPTPPGKAHRSSAMQLPPPSAFWQVGDVVDGRYEVLGEIGRGGMGVVYKVLHREWNLEMAVKTPLPQLIQDATSKSRFFREAQAWVDLGMHPNIVQCWYVRDLGGLPRVFADFMAGGSLKDWFKGGRIKPGNWGAIMDVVLQACDGLAYAHGFGLIHRDVKPGNLLMAEDGRLCVTDFGLVKSMEAGDGPPALAEDQIPPTTSWAGAKADEELTMAGALMGTPEYGAPEQWSTREVVDARADVYALGIILYELCCGRRPFDDGKTREPPQVLMGRHLTSTPPHPGSFRPDIPDSLAQIMLACLAKEKNDRVSSMDDLRVRLVSAFEDITKKPYPRPKPRPADMRADGLNNRAVSMFDLGRREQAGEAWDEAFRLDAQHPETLFNRGLMKWYSATGTDFDLQEALREAARTYPRSKIYVGYVALEGQDNEGAARSLLEALEDEELRKDGMAWRALGDAHMALREFEKARKAYSQALKRIPRDAQCLRSYGLSQAGTTELNGERLFPNRSCLRSLDGRVGTVKALAITSDGRYAFSENGADCLSRWNLATGKIDTTYFGHTRTVTAVALTGAGDRVVAGSDDSTIRCWEMATAKKMLDFYGKGHIGAVNVLAATSDGQYAISGGGDRSVRCWELRKGTLVHTWWGHEKGVSAVALAPDGKRIASASEDGSICIWSLGSEERAGSLNSGLEQVRCLAWAPPAFTGGANILLTGGSDGGLFLADLDTGQAVRRFFGHRGAVNSACISAHGRWVVSGGDDRTIRLWDTGSGRCLRTFLGPDGPVQRVALAEDGRFLVSGAKESIGHPLLLWDLGEEVATEAGFKCSFAISKAQNQKQSQETRDRFDELLDAVETVLAGRDYGSAYLALVEARRVKGYERDPRAMALNRQLSAKLPRKEMASGYLQAEFDSGHQAGCRSLALSPNGKWALSIGKDEKEPRLWEMETGTCVAHLTGHKQWVQALSISADGQVAATGGSDGRVCLWDLMKQGTCIRSLSGHDDEVCAVHWGRDGQFLFSAGVDRSVCVWERGTGNCLKKIENMGATVEWVVGMPTGGLFLAARSDGIIGLWSLRSGKCLKTFEGHEGALSGLLVSADGRRMVSSGEDRTLRIWNIDAGLSEGVLDGPQARFGSIVLTDDGHYVFSAGAEGQESPIRLWDLKSGECVRTFALHVGGIDAIAGTPDGMKLISVGADRFLRYWDLEWELDPGKGRTFSLEAHQRQRLTASIPPPPPAASGSQGKAKAPIVPAAPKPPIPQPPPSRPAVPIVPPAPAPRSSAEKKKENNTGFAQDPFGF